MSDQEPRLTLTLVLPTTTMEEQWWVSVTSLLGITRNTAVHKCAIFYQSHGVHRTSHPPIHSTYSIHVTCLPVLACLKCTAHTSIHTVYNPALLSMQAFTFTATLHRQHMTQPYTCTLPHTHTHIPQEPYPPPHPHTHTHSPHLPTLTHTLTSPTH